MGQRMDAPSYRLTPRNVADRLNQKKTDGVLTLIHRGELLAVNTSSGDGAPRWRISEVDFAAFLERRRSKPPAKPETRRRRSEPAGGYTRFFEE